MTDEWAMEQVRLNRARFKKLARFPIVELIGEGMPEVRNWKRGTVNADQPG